MQRLLWAARGILVVVSVLLFGHSLSRPTESTCYAAGGSVEFSGRHCVYQSGHRVRFVPLRPPELSLAATGLLATLLWAGLGRVLRRTRHDLRRFYQAVELLGYVLIAATIVSWAVLARAVVSTTDYLR